MAGINLYMLEVVLLGHSKNNIRSILKLSLWRKQMILRYYSLNSRNNLDGCGFKENKPRFCTEFSLKPQSAVRIIADYVMWLSDLSSSTLYLSCNLYHHSLQSRNSITDLKTKNNYLNNCLNHG